MFIISPYQLTAPATMIAAIQSLGLTSGLKLCLDASDVDSYGGSGQSWLDTSGNGYDFFRGTTAASQSTDPTFNGVAGAQSSAEYWSFDGGDRFTYDTTNESWMENVHKNNAKFACAAWVRVPDSGSRQCLVGDHGDSTSEIGFSIDILEPSPSLQPRFVVNKAAGGSTTAFNFAHGSTLTANAWQFLAVRIDEGASEAMIQIQDDQDTGSGAYSSPSSSNASRTLQIADNGLSSGFPQPFSNGARLANISMWEGTIPTVADMVSLYNATKAKFGY